MSTAFGLANATHARMEVAMQDDIDKRRADVSGSLPGTAE